MIPETRPAASTSPGTETSNLGERRTSIALLWLSALLPLVLLAALVAMLMRTGPPGVARPEGMPPVERLVIDRATLDSDGIHLSVLNDGPDPVTIAQVMVDDAYWAFTAADGQTLRHLGRTSIAIPYPWVSGETHLVTEEDDELRTALDRTFHTMEVRLRRAKEKRIGRRSKSVPPADGFAPDDGAEADA